MPNLFDPLSIRDVTLPRKISREAVHPAEESRAGQWD